MQQRRYRITGRVQGVFFRASTREQALVLELSGHAINLPDGAVEVLACGEPAALDRLGVWLWQGPSRAKVVQVELVEQADVNVVLSGFVTG